MKKQLLAARIYGDIQKPALVLIHGLFGSARNWDGILRTLAQDYYVIGLDMRNHGSSFHDQAHSLKLMVDDVAFWLSENHIRPHAIIGHSMGGLVTMALALKNPFMINKIVVVDIAPCTYAFQFDQEFKVLQSDLSIFNDRKSMDAALKQIMPDTAKRQFFMTNIIRGEQGFRWQINVEALIQFRQKMEQEITEFYNKQEPIEKPVSFIFGSESPFFKNNCKEKIEQMFDNAEMRVINGAGHWLHFTHKSEFLHHLNLFLSKDFLNDQGVV